MLIKPEHILRSRPVRLRFTSLLQSTIDALCPRGWPNRAKLLLGAHQMLPNCDQLIELGKIASSLFPIATTLTDTTRTNPPEST
jgi:hypothetical protein